MADVCEVLAVARIDPATYGVLSQAGPFATEGPMVGVVRISSCFVSCSGKGERHLSSFAPKDHGILTPLV